MQLQECQSRLTQETGDLTKNIGKEYAADLAINHPGCHLWGSLPCTVWSALQNANTSKLGRDT